MYITPESKGRGCVNRVDSVFLQNVYITMVDQKK